MTATAEETAATLADDAFHDLANSDIETAIRCIRERIAAALHEHAAAARAQGWTAGAEAMRSAIGAHVTVEQRAYFSRIGVAAPPEEPR